MTQSLIALREKFQAKSKEAKHILEEKGDAVWTKEDNAKFDAAMDEAEVIKAQIDAHQRKIELDAEESFKDVDDFKVNGNAGKDSASVKAMDVFFRKSVREMSAQDALLIRNAMSTTTNSEGGFTVQSDVAMQFVDAIKAFGFMRQEASQIVTSSGAPLSYPTTDGTAESGEWVAQNTTASSADVTFGTVAVNVFKAGSKIITVPIELLQDSNIDVQALVFNRAAQRIGRIANVGYTTGTGSGQPQGFVGVSGVGKVGATGQTVTITYDDLVDIMDSLDIGYQGNGQRSCWMFNQSMRKVLRKIKDTAGRPVWTPSYDAGISSMPSDQLLGYDVCINNDMATPAANAKSLAFGQFGSYLIRDALDVSLFRFDDSAYMTKGQVGFLAWARTGGNLLDTNAVKLYQHSAT